ncbi:MAG: transporter substrate-binding domain-containing protein, partial [Candidatus Cloacimonetes bacterium]|nr:transporter substrate-binding domain-containing protein [Candidatus Cloacimonadota bacterium]
MYIFSRKTLNLILFCCITFFAYAEEQSTEISDVLKTTLIMTGDNNYPPYEFVNQNGEPDGFNIDLINALAKALNLSVKIELRTWEYAKNAVESGEAEIITLMHSAERDKIYDFARPNLIVTHGIYVPENSRISDINALIGK